MFSGHSASRETNRRATLWLLQILALAVSAFVFAGTRSPVHGLARLASPQGVVGNARVARVAATPGALEQWQRPQKRSVLDNGAVEADVADEDVDERDDDRESVAGFAEAAIALRRTGSPREPARALRVALERDPSRFRVGRGISRGPPV